MRGIIFFGDHVAKIIAGKKTQTRRLILPQPKVCCEDELEAGDIVDRGTKGLFRLVNHRKNSAPYHRGWLLEKPFKPRYQVGETLYCKETWGLIWNQLSDDREEKRVIYKSDSKEMPEDNGGRGCWKSSMHMPEWASRCHIRIVRIKAERIQDISEDDAMAEGTELINGRYTFACLWDLINPKHPSSSNPWVFAYTFEVVRHCMANRERKGGVE